MKRVRLLKLLGPLYLPAEQELLFRREVAPLLRCVRVAFMAVALLAFTAVFYDLVRALKWAMVLSE